MDLKEIGIVVIIILMAICVVLMSLISRRLRVINHYDLVKAKLLTWDNLIYAIVAILLLSMVLIGLVGIFHIRFLEHQDWHAPVFSMVISGIALFIATAVFLPKFTMNQIIKDHVHKELKKHRLDKNYMEIEILKTEAHDNRMNAYFLLESRQYLWATGWAIKALKHYLTLKNRNDFSINYDDLIDVELIDAILKPLLKKLKKSCDWDYNKVVRLLKDYYDVRCLLSMKMNNNKSLPVKLKVIDDCIDCIRKIDEEAFDKITLKEIKTKTVNCDRSVDEWVFNRFNIN